MQRTLPQLATTTGRELPAPRRGARWRWSTPRKTLVTGGVLASVLSLVTGTAAVGATRTPASSSNGAGPRRQPPAGAARPTVLGRISALSGADITVQTSGEKTTIVSTPATSFKTMSGPSGASTHSSASALRVGDFIGAQGTENSDGTVTASSIVISTGPPPAGPGARQERHRLGRFPSS
jgi:Domain of unknown function (DUF5666)